MLKKVAIGTVIAGLVLTMASGTQAGEQNSSGDYKGGALFGPLPGQVFSYGPGAAYYGYGPGAAYYGYAYAPYRRGGRTFGYVPSLREEFPNAPWDEY